MRAQVDQPGIFDDGVLDEYLVPFGEWAAQAVDWMATEISWLFDGVGWPVTFLIDDVVSGALLDVSWVYLVSAVALVAAWFRGIKAAGFVAMALTVCGLLGEGYWEATVTTFGSMVVVMLLCAVVAIPLGVVCGLNDACWRVARTVLDSWQWVHVWVYLLPVIFFWGLGPTAAVMATALFALPPLARLTSLGIRQVPSGLVEAGRACGASEWRLLIDLRLPLARSSIAQGMHETLLLAVVVFGLAAVIGAGGFGSILFQALVTQSLATMASAGLAFFLVAAVLDRLIRPGRVDEVGLLRRTRGARERHEGRIGRGTQDNLRTQRPAQHPIGASERAGLLVVTASGLVVIGSLWLPWARGGGYLSSFGNSADHLGSIGESFDGLAAAGGSWFGILTLLVGGYVVLAAVASFRRPGTGPRWLSLDGVTVGAVALAVMNTAHVLATPPDQAPVERGVGMYIALGGVVVMAAGAIWWSRLAPYAAYRDRAGGASRVALVSAMAVVVLAGAMLAGWSFDQRPNVVMSPETQVELDQLRERAERDPADAGAIAAEIEAFLAQSRPDGVVMLSGVEEGGPRLGLWSFLAGVAALVAALWFDRRPGERRRWFGAAIVGGIGAGILLIGVGWIGTLARNADPDFNSGVGGFLAAVAGALVLRAAYQVLAEYHREPFFEAQEVRL